MSRISMKNVFIFLFSLLILNACASKKPSETSHIDPELIRKTIREHAKDILSCYEIYLKNKPHAEGKLILEWVIIDEGKVEKVKLAKNTFDDEILFNCCADKLKTWIFPTPPKGQEAVVHYPFLFNGK